ncbi:Translation initiation factor eIF-2B subunit alpha [Ananas comosus]|uniref:Translation initiation factor eIF2B subunit alpha n=1 Tax=Ananas comosus TaxID=4615 RepID=A0A199UMT5_ANACO|nr:Translation initiation factor eIF-2B subunit alpha [Ananas comosus]
MWRRSASFVVDKRYYQHDELPLAMDPQNPNPNPNPNANPLSAYYLTRAEHHAVVTSDWLAQAQAAVGRHPRRAAAGDDRRRGGGRRGVRRDRRKPDLAEAVAAIMALAAVIRSSEATTMMELEIELKTASDTLKSWDTTSISLSAGCDLFMRYVTRTSALEYEDFDAAKRRLIERGEKFGEISLKARRTIAMLCQDFIFDGCTILVHGFSRVVLEVLKLAASNRKLFRFARMYPLDQKDLAPALRPIEFGVPIPPGVEVEKSARDYTPPQYLTLLFTDLGALTPSVVSDELIQLYL